MANSKISALTAATTPVAGTEVLPIVQSSATVKLAISDLTPGLSTITAAKGGTGQTSYAVGDILYADTTTTLAKLADVATGNAVISGGVSTSPSWGKVGLTTHVSGILPVANGGTNASTASITSFNNITGYTASGATGTTSTNLVFSTSPTLVTPTLGAALATSIKFGSGTVLSTYEEGTWTAAFACTSGTITISASYTTGSYTKIGRQVTLTGLFLASSVSSPTGVLTITGLPFTSATTNKNGSAGTVWAYGLNATTSPIMCKINANTNIIQIDKFVLGSAANLAGDMIANSQFTLSITYFTA